MSGFFMFLWLIISVSFLVTLVITIVNKLRKKEGRITKKTPIILFVAGFVFFILAAMTSPTTSESATNSSSSNSKVNKEKVASSKAKEAAAKKARAAKMSLASSKAAASSRSEQARIKSSEKASSESASSKASSEAAQKASSEESASVAQSNSVAESQSRVDSEKAAAASVSNAAQQNDTDTTQTYTGTSEQIIGNARSHIYHVPGQAGYHMNSANAVYFNSEAEAQAAGYRKSQR